MKSVSGNFGEEGLCAPGGHREVIAHVIKVFQLHHDLTRQNNPIREPGLDVG
jgi:hypothetical protein